MDLVSIETPEENTMVENIINKYGSDGVWTSGRLCNFHGCNVNVSFQISFLLIQIITNVAGTSSSTQTYQWMVLVWVRF